MSGCFSMSPGQNGRNGIVDGFNSLASSHTSPLIVMKIHLFLRWNTHICFILRPFLVKLSSLCRFCIVLSRHQLFISMFTDVLSFYLHFVLMEVQFPETRSTRQNHGTNYKQTTGKISPEKKVWVYSGMKSLQRCPTTENQLCTTPVNSHGSICG